MEFDVAEFDGATPFSNFWLKNVATHIFPFSEWATTNVATNKTWNSYYLISQSYFWRKKMEIMFISINKLFRIAIDHSQINQVTSNSMFNFKDNLHKWNMSVTFGIYTRWDSITILVTKHTSIMFFNPKNTGLQLNKSALLYLIYRELTLVKMQ